MRKAHAPWAIALALAASVAVSACSSVQAESRELRVTAAQLTRQIQPSFPQRRCLLAFACVTLRKPVITLHDDDQRLFVAADVGLDLNGNAAGKGRALIAGVPRYDSRKGAFFLDTPQLESLDVAGLGRAEQGLARQVLNGMLAENILADQPIWTLDESDPQQAMAKLTLRKVSVRDGVLVLTMGDDGEVLPEDFSDEEDAGAGQADDDGGAADEDAPGRPDAAPGQGDGSGVLIRT